MKTKVIEKIIKNGVNKEEAIAMVEKHFDFVSKKFNKVSEIAYQITFCYY